MILQSIKNLFFREKKLTSNVVKNYYEKWNDNYLENFGDVFQSYATSDPNTLMKYIIDSAGLENGMRVLDAGCGVGGPAIRIAEHLHKVQITGITISPSQVSIANQNVSNRGLSERVDIMFGDFHVIDTLFPTNSFDAIIFLESLVHSSEPSKVIESCRGVLKEDGIIYIKDLFRHYDAAIQNDIDFAVARVEELIKMKVQDVRTLEKLLLEDDFNIEFIRPLNIIPDFTNGNKFMANNNFRIFKDRNEVYNGNEFQYLMYYEIKAVKKSGG